MNPKGVQRTRKKGQPGIPEGAVYVGRGSALGNPFPVERQTWRDEPRWVVRWHKDGPVRSRHDDQGSARQAAVDYYAEWIGHDTLDPGEWPNELIVPHVRAKAAINRGDLAGKDLACWCAVGSPCHRQHLLSLLNPELRGAAA